MFTKFSSYNSTTKIYVFIPLLRKFMDFRYAPAVGACPLVSHSCQIWIGAVPTREEKEGEGGDYRRVSLVMEEGRGGKAWRGGGRPYD